MITRTKEVNGLTVQSRHGMYSTNLQIKEANYA